MSELSPRQREVKEEFERVRGTWSDPWDAILRLDPEFLAAYTEFSGVPWGRDHLEPKVKEFIYVAADGAATHMYGPGLRAHLRKAIEFGATEAELAEVLELTATLGIHACNVGVPILLEVLEERGEGELPPLSAEQERLKAEFTEKRGYWHETWEGLLHLDPELFAGYLRFSAHPWEQGVLDPKVKEFIYIAFDAAATHLYVKGLKLHIENALEYGATAGEVMEVLAIVSTIGIHAVNLGAPMLLEELSETRQAGS